MKYYIDKSAVVAEIEGRIEVYEESEMNFHLRISELKNILSFINTLEVKEEVTTIDAFIEKATSYIQQHWIWNTKMIEDFKNYMKGE